MVGAQAFRTVLKICCKSFLVYLGTTRVAIRIKVMERFAFEGPADWFDNFESGGEKESKKTSKECSQLEWLRLWIEVILGTNFFLEHFFQ